LCVNVENIERIKARHRESIDRVTGARVLVPKPYFVLDGGRLHLNQVPVPLQRPIVGTGYVDPDGEAPDHQLTGWLNGLARRAPIFSDRVRHLLETRLLRARGALLRSVGFQPHSDYRSPQSEGWKLMQAIVERFHCGSAPVPLLLVPIPTYHFYLHGVQ